MTRNDRILAVLLALMQGRETARSLAEKFEVSRRTILRDVQALSEMGVPVYASPGPNGGYGLVSEYKMPPLQLDAREALTVLFSLKATLGYADTPFNAERWTVLNKVRAVLPADVLREIEPLLDRMDIDVPRRRYRSPHLDTILEHAAASRWLEGEYRSQRRSQAVHIRPDRVYAAHGYWYCEAYSVTHAECRIFRVDRFDTLRSARPPENPVSQPSGSGSSAPGPDGPRVRVIARLTYAGMIRAEQDPHFGEYIRPIGNEQWLLDFRCPQSEVEWTTGFFFGLASDVEVLQPQSMRDEIARRAMDLARRYESKATERGHREPAAASMP